jgi:polyketide biosynthesis enoyl-CoA hydratase PksI
VSSSVLDTQAVLSMQAIGPGILQLTMHDREHKNTFSTRLIGALLEAFEAIRKDKTHRAIVLTGYDSYFCSGGTQESLTMLHEGKGKFSDTNLYSLALECEIPVIAAMQGHGIGGGFVFGMFSDFIVLSRESIYTTNFMKYGFTPGMGATYVLPKKLGISLAQEMLTSARTFRGEELARRGVAFPVLPRVEVLPYAHQLARDIADKPRRSLVELKSHLVREIRQQLPAVIEQEVAMHEITFHQPEVKERIERLFGR